MVERKVWCSDCGDCKVPGKNKTNCEFSEICDGFLRVMPKRLLLEIIKMGVLPRDGSVQLLLALEKINKKEAELGCFVNTGHY